MYAQFWGLRDTPFTTNVDPRTYVETSVHEEAMARLLYLIEQRRHCGVLLGDRGCGKTMLFQTLARHLRRTQATVITEDLLGVSGIEFAWKLVNQLGCRVNDTASIPLLWRTLQDGLEGHCSGGRPTIILLDHVERSAPDCLGVLHRLIHSTIPLAGHVTVILSLRNDNLAPFLPLLREVSELRIEIGPLTSEQTREYVQQLIQRVGGSPELFDGDLWDALYQFSSGNPREIHRICDLALVAGMSEQATSISRHHLQVACDDLSSILWEGGRTSLVTTTKF